MARDRSQHVPAIIQPPFEEVYSKKSPLWGFFQIHFHAAVISVSAFCYLGLSTPKRAFSRRLVAFRSSPWREGRCSLTLSLSFSTQTFTSCMLCYVSLAFQVHVSLRPLAAGHYSCFLLVLACHSHPCGPYASPVYGKKPLEEHKEDMGFGNIPSFKSQVPYFLGKCLEQTMLVFCPDLLYSFHATLQPCCAFASKGMHCNPSL